jgi:hypothetical protein
MKKSLCNQNLIYWEVLSFNFFTINAPVVYMARDVMILMRANPFRGPLEGAGPENRDFSGSEMATSAAAVDESHGAHALPPHSVSLSLIYCAIGQPK